MDFLFCITSALDSIDCANCAAMEFNPMNIVCNFNTAALNDKSTGL